MFTYTFSYLQQEFLHPATKHPKYFDLQNFFSRTDLHIPNNARHLVTLARFLASHFAHKTKFFSKKTCYNFIASLARAIPGATKKSPHTAVPGV